MVVIQEIGGIAGQSDSARLERAESSCDFDGAYEIFPALQFSCVQKLPAGTLNFF